VTTRRTHEEVETRLVRGLERTIPKPRIVEHYRTTGPIDFRAAWALDGRFCGLECEVKTTSKSIRKVPLPPDQERFRRGVRALARIIAPKANTFDMIHRRSPVLMYAVFVYRKKPRAEPETFIHTESKLAQSVLEAAWKEGALRGARPEDVLELILASRALQ